MKITQIPSGYKELGLRIDSPKTVLGKHFPDFMLIGPQRTGTTWLSTLLRSHPNVHMTTPKEPRYFNNLIRKAKYKVSTDFMWYLSLFELPFLARLDNLWHSIQRKHDLPILRGEATASTAVVLTNEYIRFLCDINPNIKFILGVRNPVDRAWSSIKKNLIRDPKRNSNDVSEQEMLEYIVSNEYLIQCGLHSNIKEKWLSVIPSDQLFILQFPHIVNKPVELFVEICDFLEIPRPSEQLLKKIEETGRINTTLSLDIPDAVNDYLKRAYSEELHFLNECYPAFSSMKPNEGAFKS